MNFDCTWRAVVHCDCYVTITVNLHKTQVYPNPWKMLAKYDLCILWRQCKRLFGLKKLNYTHRALTSDHSCYFYQVTLSCEYDHPVVLEVLLHGGASVSSVNPTTGETALHLAARQGSTDMVDVILRFKPKLNILSTEGFAPLHLAAMFGHVKVVTRLLDAGADINVLTVDGATSLHLATRENHLMCVQTLVVMKADQGVRDEDGFTAGESARQARPSHEYVADYLKTVG